MTILLILAFLFSAGSIFDGCLSFCSEDLSQPIIRNENGSIPVFAPDRIFRYTDRGFVHCILLPE